MPEFQYKALTTGGDEVSGVVSAPSRPRAIELLAERGSLVTDISDKKTDDALTNPGVQLGSLLDRNRVSPAARSAMLRQLAVALGAGLTLLSALQVVEQQAESPAVNRLAGDLAKRVQAGESLSDAMRAHPDVFSLMQVSMTHAGEVAGALDRIMASLADFAERDTDIRQKLQSAAIYPMIIVGLAFISILVIVLFILPRIMETLNETGSQLPLPTKVLMWAVGTIRSPTGIVIGICLIAAAVFAIRWARTPEGRFSLDRWKLKTPVIGTAVRRVAVARFARTLGTLSASGVQVIEAMAIVRDTLGNEALARSLDEATAGIVRGQSIADQLRDTGQFPQLLIQVIAMGERTGKLDELLMSTADAYDRETATALQRVMTVVPVVIILCLALFVAFILAAALLPIMTMDLAGIS